MFNRGLQLQIAVAIAATVKRTGLSFIVEIECEWLFGIVYGTRKRRNFCVTVSDDDEIDYSIKPELYDSDLDDKDELWMAKKRNGRTSDAVLSCPACFTEVCFECQRHEQYVTQYRAVFVVNCEVGKDKVMQHKANPSMLGKRTRDSEKEATAPADEEKVKPVLCSSCSTEIGVVDSEEIYHFFNVIPSEP